MVRKGKHKNSSSSSPRCSKRQKTSDEDDDEQNGIFTNLPHEILLKIFEQLSITERSQMAR